MIAETVNELMNIAGGDYASFIEYYRSHSMVIGEKSNLFKTEKLLLPQLWQLMNAVGLKWGLKAEKNGFEVRRDNGKKSLKFNNYIKTFLRQFAHCTSLFLSIYNLVYMINNRIVRLALN